MLVIMSILFSISVFAVSTAVLAYVASLGLAVAFGLEVNFYGMWTLTLAAALFCLIFVQNGNEYE